MSDCKKYILIGAAGYVAPRHLKAIRETGGELVAALDPHDSVGVLDSYFPSAKFFTDIERLERYVELLRDRGQKIDYVSICSPNHLHDAHCRFALRIGADAICEKPLTVNARNVDLLMNAELRSGHLINVILQLRLNPVVQQLRNQFLSNDGRHKISVRYVTPRGEWYRHSWKADESKSGGLAANIGIHLFDLIYYLSGKSWKVYVKEKTPDTVEGYIHAMRADVEFMLSIENGAKPERTFEIDGREYDLSNGFEKLHTEAYQEILLGRGFGPMEIVEATKIAEQIRGN